MPIERASAFAGLVCSLAFCGAAMAQDNPDDFDPYPAIRDYRMILKEQAGAPLPQASFMTPQQPSLRNGPPLPPGLEEDSNRAIRIPFPEDRGIGIEIIDRIRNGDVLRKDLGKNWGRISLKARSDSVQLQYRRRF